MTKQKPIPRKRHPRKRSALLSSPCVALNRAYCCVNCEQADSDSDDDEPPAKKPPGLAQIHVAHGLFVHLVALPSLKPRVLNLCHPTCCLQSVPSPHLGLFSCIQL